jgi:beta-lactamase class A
MAIAVASTCLAFSPAAVGGSQSTATARSSFRDTLDTLAHRALPGTLGIAVFDPRSGMSWRVNADRAYPMMSVFKAPVAAMILARIDAGTLSLDQKVTLTRADVRDGSAVPSIGAHFVGERMTFTVERLLVAAVSESDNTAADALVRLAGGPGEVTAFLKAHGIDGMRVDLDEGGVASIFDDVQDGKPLPEHETPQQEHERRLRGFRAYLADPRNRSTPDAAIAFLRKLWSGELLSHASTQRLIGLMEAQTVPDRLRAGLPDGIRFADKCGTSTSLDGQTAAYNDIGAITWPDGHIVFVAAFLTASHASTAERNALFAELGRDLAAAFGSWGPRSDAGKGGRQ